MSDTSPSTFLDEPFKNAWRGKDIFAEVQALSDMVPASDIYRNKEGRRTLRFEFAGKSWFLKYHRGVGWKEIIKNIAQGRLPVLGASNEYEAARALTHCGVDTLTPVGYGRRGANPATQESFLITVDLANTISLEDYCRHWNTQPPLPAIRHRLVRKLALAAQRMHACGINHRDFYICHFLLDEKSLTSALQNNTSDFCCYLIDLHRCQRRPHVPYRWRVKDLGGLLYSGMDAGLRARDCYRFIKAYTGKSLRETLQDGLWGDVLANANRLYHKDFGKTAPQIFPGSLLRK